MKKTLLRTFAAGGLLVVCYGGLRGGFAPKNLVNGLFIWSDGISMIGILLILASGAIALNRKGIFDIVAYALFQARFLLLHHKSEEYVNYHDFKLLKERSTYPVPGVLLAGIIFLLSGAVLTWIYYRVSAGPL